MTLAAAVSLQVRLSLYPAMTGAIPTDDRRKIVRDIVQHCCSNIADTKIELPTAIQYKISIS